MEYLHAGDNHRFFAFPRRARPLHSARMKHAGKAAATGRRMIIWTLVLLGVVLGVVFGIALMYALREEGLEVISVPVGQLALFLALSVLVGMLAAVLPARRAARLDVLGAIATE